jgi:hypothetical protein
MSLRLLLRNRPPPASASSEQTLREINTRLREIHRVIGNSSGVFNLLGQVREINRKTR